METGVADQARHIMHVTDMYPRLQALGAERIYWYALWAGDTGVDSEFSLIKNPLTPAFIASPLFAALTEAG
jgi:hypothetical protein